MRAQHLAEVRWRGSWRHPPAQRAAARAEPPEHFLDPAVRLARGETRRPDAVEERQRQLRDHPRHVPVVDPFRVPQHAEAAEAFAGNHLQRLDHACSILDT
jgi:hypothetical protein